MILFDSKLPLYNGVTPEDIHSLCKKWVGTRSSHRISVPEYEGKDGEFHGRRSQLILKHFHIDNEFVVSYRLRQVNAKLGEEWLVDILFFANASPKYVQIQLSCNRTDGRDISSNAQPPNIFKLLLNSEKLCAADGEIPISNKARSAEEYMDLCSDIMNDTTSTFLPVIYVSCDDDEKTAIDANMLAERLFGIAHVFVETSSLTGWSMKSRTNGRNAHHGYVGIYVSDPYAYTLIAPEAEKISVQNIEAALRKFYLNRSITTRDHLYLKQLCAENADIGELNDLLRAADQELSQMDALKRENRELLTKINSLMYDNDALKQSLKEKQADKLFYHPGDEPEFYKGEKNDLLFYALVSARTNSPNGSRRAHLIDSLLKANPEVGTNRKLLDDLCRILRSGNDLNEHTIAQLYSLGFRLKSENNHYKLVFYDDDRYTITAPKTGSDHRGFQNMFSVIRNLIQIG